MLLEKPFAVNSTELKELVDIVKETGRRVYICHVLRYTKFYSEIKQRLLNGDIGKVISIQQDEHVSYHHMAVSYVRGKWRSEKVCFAPMLLAKSCHDIDLMMWMLSDTEPEAVSSFGGDFQFTPDKKPQEAGTRCMLDCPLNDKCIFSAESNYVEPHRWDQYVNQALEAKGHNWKLFEPLTEEKKAILIDSLNTYNDYGKCVWDCERDGNVDHQSVIVNFKNGATGVFNMVGGTAKSERNIHIIGTKGEIKGEFSTGKYRIRTINPKAEGGYIEEEIDINMLADSAGERGGHGGGDLRLIADFCNVLEGGEKSISCTDIMDSTKSHNHPNAGGVLILGLGCENNNIAEFKKVLGDYNPDRVKFLNTQDCEDEISEGIKLIDELENYVAKFERKPVSVSKLKLGLKCGGSDGFSGISANPLVGRLSDKLISMGGSCVLTEVPEMFGAEHLLMKRCRTREVFDKTVALINGFKDYFTRHNQVIYENPSPGNKAGGITTLEEKSLGCIQKGGMSEVVNVLQIGDVLTENGLSLLDGPGNDIVAITNLTAAGVHIVLFTTGRGTPVGAPVPTVKISTNKNLAEKKKNWIDFDASPTLDGNELTDEFFDYIISVASGEQTRNEMNGYREISIFKDGIVL